MYEIQNWIMDVAENNIFAQAIATLVAEKVLGFAGISFRKAAKALSMRLKSASKAIEDVCIRISEGIAIRNIEKRRFGHIFEPVRISDFAALMRTPNAFAKSRSGRLQNKVASPQSVINGVGDAKSQSQIALVTRKVSGCKKDELARPTLSYPYSSILRLNSLPSLYSGMGKGCQMIRVG